MAAGLGFGVRRSGAELDSVIGPAYTSDCPNTPGPCAKRLAAQLRVLLDLKSSSVDGTSLKTVRDPAEQDPEGLIWDSQVRHTIVKEGFLYPREAGSYVGYGVHSTASAQQ
ncbi:hypothetical protein FOZ60_014175 [Perkinsus olseni]|uniref:Uncharacterized protein n=1 Tax=Perkinsus olseni TaxID=32597 RepID=A0A7J6N951_PEROL|nr:hypothetical protein FOZ60_014175 [Perkinsus olseni]